MPPNTQPNPLSTTTSSPTATRTQPPISQPNDQLASTSSSNQNHVYNPNERLSKGPVLLLGDSMIRGIQQRKFAPDRYVNKQTIAGGSREKYASTSTTRRKEMIMITLQSFPVQM